MLKVNRLQVHGLEPVSFTLEAGQVLVVRGPSGSGKSLLLRAIADLDPVRGEISLDGQDKDQFAAESWRKIVRYQAAESGWWLERVEEHFSDLPLAIKRGAQLDLPEKLFASPVAHLSSGERQRLAFVRALEDHPGVLLLDEPTSALDEHAEELMEKKIVCLQQKGMIVIIVTHSNAQAQRLATHTLDIKDGATSFKPV